MFILATFLYAKIKAEMEHSDNINICLGVVSLFCFVFCLPFEVLCFFFCDPVAPRNSGSVCARGNREQVHQHRVCSGS